MKKDAATDLTEMMTVRDVAKYLRCNLSTVWRLANSCDLRGFRLRKEWRFRREDVERWIAQEKERSMDPASKPSSRRGRWKRS